MRDTILRAMLGAAIGLGFSMLMAFVKFAVAENIYPQGGLIPLLPSGLTAAIIIAIMIGIIGGIIGLIVGALDLRPYQGAAVGILFIMLRWRGVFDTIRNIATQIEYAKRSGHVSFKPFVNDLLLLSMFFDVVIVGAVVSIFLRRFFTR